MRYNPSTDQAHLLDELAEQTRAVISKLNPPAPRNIVWCSLQGRWINNPLSLTVAACGDT